MFLRLLGRRNRSARTSARRAIWARTFDSADLPGELSRELKSVDEDALIDAAWLAEAILSGVGARSRMERLDQFAFGQRALPRRTL